MPNPRDFDRSPRVGRAFVDQGVDRGHEIVVVLAHGHRPRRFGATVQREPLAVGPSTTWVQMEHQVAVAGEHLVFEVERFTVDEL